MSSLTTTSLPSTTSTTAPVVSPQFRSIPSSPQPTASAVVAGSASTTPSSPSPSSPAAVNSSTPFTCSFCTFVNPAGATRCEICLQYRSPLHARLARTTSEQEAFLAAMSASPATSWICQQCTFSNRRTREKCGGCFVGTRDDALAATKAAQSSTVAKATSSKKKATKAAAASTSSVAPASSSSSASASVHRSKRRKGAAAAEYSDESDEPGAARDDDDEEDGENDDDDDDDDDGDEDMADPSDAPLKGIKNALLNAVTPARKTVKAKRSPAPSLAYPAHFSSPTPASAVSAMTPLANATSSLSITSKKGAKTSTPATLATAVPASTTTSSSSSSSTTDKPSLTNEGSRKELSDSALLAYHERYLVAANIHKSYGAKSQPKGEEKEQSASIREVVKELYEQLEYNPSAAASSSSSSASLRSNECSVCFAEFVEGETQPPTIENCGHAQLCRDCFKQYVEIKVKDEAVVPWLICPIPDCRHPLTPQDLITSASLSTKQLAHLCTVSMRKRLVRAEPFVPCSQSGCQGGFIVQNHKNGKVPKPSKKTCALCQTEQMVEKGKAGELDETFKQWIAAGTLRPCPKCQHLTMKEKGVCNVLQCVKCSVWWNWRSKETGKDSTELKQRARMSGTLWEHGELQYQQQLERTNPKEFKALLERNGQKYDPNYIRGQ